MEEKTFSQAEISSFISIFKDIRSSLSFYMNDRDFKMSNSQIFTFLLYAPIALGIAADRVVDENEIKLLANLSKNIDVNKIVNIDLMTVLSVVPEPEGVMINEEFNMRVDAEILFLARNIDKYESFVINALKSFLKLDNAPTAETSLTKTFNKWFDFVIEKNAGKNKDTELRNIQSYKAKLGI